MVLWKMSFEELVLKYTLYKVFFSILIHLQAKKINYTFKFEINWYCVHFYLKFAQKYTHIHTNIYVQYISNKILGQKYILRTEAT